MNKNILLLLISIFSYTASYTQADIYKSYTIKIGITHDLSYDHLKWQKIIATTKSLINFYNSGKLTETNAANFGKDLTLLHHALKSIESLIADDNSFDMYINTFYKEELPSTYENISHDEMIEITILFKVFNMTSSGNKNKIDMLMFDFATNQIMLPIRKTIQVLHDTAQAILQSLSGNAHIYVSIFEKPTK